MRPLGTLVVLGALTLSPAARADDQECAVAYDRALTARRASALREAREDFIRCAQPTCSEIVQRECVRALRENEAALPTMSFRARDAAGRDLVDVKVYFDDQLIAPTLTGRAIAVDPGMHRFRFEHGGAPPVTLDGVLVAEGEKSRVLNVEFPADKARASPPPPPLPPPEAPSRIPLYATFGVAGAATIVGVVTGVLALDKASTLRAECPDHHCPPDRHDDRSSASTIATVSTVSLVFAGATAGLAVALWLTSTPTPAKRMPCLRVLDVCLAP